MNDTPVKKVRHVEGRSLPMVKTVGQARSPFEDVYHSVLTRPWWQFFVMVSLAWLALITVFAVAYALLPGAIANAHTLEDAFFFSVQTISTIGYGVMSPVTRAGHLVVTFETLVGTLFLALLTGATFAKFARPTAKILFCEKAVVCPRNGVPHLMVRMANWRHNAVVDAQARIFVLVTETSLEGEVMRRPWELKLVRERTPFFALTWTAMHPIDESSPLHDQKLLDQMRADGAEIFVSISAFDLALSQTVNAQHAYRVSALAWNARFADVMTVLPSGLRVVDYTKFHQVNPIAPRA
jgi:inward rectifier potassium channel